MNFKNSVTPLGKGRVTYACADKENATLLLRTCGEIRGVSVDLASKAVKDLGTVSRADECIPTRQGKIEKLGELYYVEERISGAETEA